jgi:uroporphyrinogen-III synthase
MTDSKIRILSTAILDQRILDQALPQGIQLDQLSFIETHPVTSDQLTRRILDLATQSRAVAFTSSHALWAVGEVLSGVRPPWRIYVLDGETKKKTIALFGKEAIRQTASDSLSLAQKILADQINNLVFFCGTLRREELPDLLRSNQVDLLELVVYQTKALPHTLDRTYDGILFFSPSGVESFFSVNRPNPDATLFAIGQTTARAVRKYSTNLLITASKPGKRQLVSQSIDHFLHTRLPSGSPNTRNA